MTNLQKYLDKSVEVLDKYGFFDKVQEESQLAKLLDDIVDVDQARIVSIGKTVRHLSAFSDLVREKVQDTMFLIDMVI